MKSATARVAGAVLLVVLLTGGCGGRGQQSRVFHDEGLAAAAPSPAQWEAMLMAELDRLGIDPDKTASAAPQGDDNRVFFLTAYVQDPDGTGPQVPTSVTLRWVERCAGDYNQDGLVGVSDLTPLGQRFNEQVDYYDPEQRGIDCWPVGPPLDDGGAGAGNPPADGSPAENWRLARIDGNTDGLIGVSDITPIAQHWQERLNGYRVYRIRPGEAGFTALPNADDPGLGYTVPRSAAFPAGSTSADPLRPVHYEFVDDQLGAANGVYEYYVVPYDSDADEEGTPSMPVPADMGSGGGGSQPPRAVLVADVEYGAAPLVVTFDAADSWDPDGVIVKYEWDADQNPSTWEYDSTPDTTLQWTYNAAGTQDQWVRVTDNDGLTATTHFKVSVSAPGGNLPPVAKVIPLPPEGEVPLTVNWDASDSFDNDGTIAKYEWDMDGDQTTWEYDSGTTATMEIIYNTGGEHTQYVRVTDDGGLTDTAFGSVFVGGGGGNQNPVAAFTTDVSEGDAPLAVNFDASGSSDPDGSVQQYEWDFDNDSVVDANSTIPTASYTYLNPGFYSAKLTITDDLGAQDSAYQNITAHGWATTQVDAGPWLGADVSLAVIDGRPAIAYSLNNWGVDMELRYIRANDAHGAVWPAVPMVVNDGGSTLNVGTSVSLAVVNGRPAIAFEDFTNGRLLFVRADDQDGDSWPSTQMLADTSGNTGGTYCSLAVIDGNPAITHYYTGFGDLAYVRSLNQDGTNWAAPTVADDGTSLGLYSTLLEFNNGTVIPIVAHFDATNGLVIFESATSAAGTTWNTPALLCNNGDCTNSASMAIIDGLPAVVYFGLDQFSVPGLNYIRATASSFTWGTMQQLVTGGTNGMRPCIAEVSGRPAVAYKFQQSPTQDILRYVAATDADGTTWGSIETVDAVHNTGFYVRLIEVDGRPAIAYIDDDTSSLWFAYRY